MKTVTIDLAERSYPVYIGNSSFTSIGDVYVSHALPNNVAIITDTGVPRVYLRHLTNILKHNGIKTESIIIPSGERQKSLTRARAVYEGLLNYQAKRQSTIIALGGGVVGDLAGFVAATYRRGVPFVQVPTTLLGQVESSIGGKTGINIANTKNAVGAFYQPKFVFSDVQLLATLPQREMICGIGEILKYGYLNNEMFSFLDQHLESILKKDFTIIEETLVRCNTLKAQMISEDERETSPHGGRFVLNLGHTVGHALEILSKYKLHHGEAVVVGLLWELAIAKEAQCIDNVSFEKLSSLLRRVGFTPRLNFLSPQHLMKSIFGTKTKAKFILPKAIGKIEAVEIESSLFRSVLKNKKAGF